MTGESSYKIANLFLSTMNPSHWNGEGHQPNDFDRRIFEYPISPRFRLDISLNNDDIEGWKCYCEIVDEVSNDVLVANMCHNICSASVIADTICKLFAKKEAV